MGDGRAVCSRRILLPGGPTGDFTGSRQFLAALAVNASARGPHRCAPAFCTLCGGGQATYAVHPVTLERFLSPATVSSCCPLTAGSALVLTLSCFLLFRPSPTQPSPNPVAQNQIQSGIDSKQSQFIFPDFPGYR